ncbi:MAG TPA: RNA pseudouridine synthase [Coprobacillaceae bacterium]|nr:RNA pseudouridine synthase [Coprobacillaceae bacterium]
MVHRIDKETSGLLMVAKNDKAHQSLSEQLKEHSVTRRYCGVGSWGDSSYPWKSQCTNWPLMLMIVKKCRSQKNNSKEAITNFTVLERYKDMSLIECRLGNRKNTSN